MKVDWGMLYIKLPASLTGPRDIQSTSGFANPPPTNTSLPLYPSANPISSEIMPPKPKYAPDLNLEASLNPQQGRHPDLSFSINPASNPNPSPDPSVPDAVTKPVRDAEAEVTYQRQKLLLEASDKPLDKLPPGGAIDLMYPGKGHKPPSNATKPLLIF
jgi:hypothetical protein